MSPSFFLFFYETEENRRKRKNSEPEKRKSKKKGKTGNGRKRKKTGKKRKETAKNRKIRKRQGSGDPFYEIPIQCSSIMLWARLPLTTKTLPNYFRKLGHTPKGAYSPRGGSRHLLETPFSEPLQRTLLRTLFCCKTHSRPPSQNPSENPSPEPFSEPFLERLRYDSLGVHPRNINLFTKLCSLFWCPSVPPFQPCKVNGFPLELLFTSISNRIANAQQKL